MPNHVRNRLIIKADEAKTNEITDFLMGKSDEDGMPCPIDFNKIVPMPESLMIESGSRGEMGEVILNKKGFYAGKEYPEVKKMFEELSAEQQQESLKIARLYRSNRKKYGHANWYGWCCENWGTKWNAYNQEKTATNEIWFDTAWSCVVRLIGILSQKFPEAEFDYTWADEDTGSNCGQAIIKNGKGWVDTPDDGSKEAFELAFEMRPEIRGYYEFKDGEYES